MLLSGLGASLFAQSSIMMPRPKATEKHPMNLVPVGEIAPNWQLTDTEGKLRSLADYRGKVVVMDFWATWCGPCAQIMPRMQKLHEKLADKGVVVFGVNAWEKGDPAAMMRKKGLTYDLLLKGEDLAEPYKITTLPVVYIVGDDGKIIYCHEGVDDKNLTSLIEKYIKGRRAI
jgi:thiol-disulfide isomerase/thioredoxin